MDKCVPSCSRGHQYHDQEADDHVISRCNFPPISADHDKGCPILPWHQEHASDHLPPSLVRGQASTSSSSMEPTVAVATSSTSHCQAERRRRERINSHLSTLRRLIPNATKLDKASLLSVVVENVKDLKRKAFEIGKGFTIPTDVDEVIVECESCSSSSNNKIMKESIILRASLCCDDRPDLFSDLNQALRSLKLQMVRADVATLAGRVRNVLILCATTDQYSREEVVCLTSLKESVKAALGRVILSRKPPPESSSNKRQRFFHHIGNF